VRRIAAGRKLQSHSNPWRNPVTAPVNHPEKNISIGGTISRAARRALF
jgi:hypothetical protein